MFHLEAFVKLEVTSNLDFGIVLFDFLCSAAYNLLICISSLRTCAAFVLMECIKDKVKDFPLIPGLDNSAAFMESCNLLKCNLSDIMSLEEIKACIGVDLRKGATKRLVEAASTIALFCRQRCLQKTNSKIK